MWTRTSNQWRKFMTMGSIAELKVKDPRTLNNPVMHRVPSVLTQHRLRADIDAQKHNRLVEDK